VSRSQFIADQNACQHPHVLRLFTQPASRVIRLHDLRHTNPTLALTKLRSPSRPVPRRSPRAQLPYSTARFVRFCQNRRPSEIMRAALAKYLKHAEAVNRIVVNHVFVPGSK
jgi:hypothetical protein